MAATRSFDLIPIAAMIRLCRTSDIVISDRRLPRGCNPRWLRLDRPMLAKTGGVSIDLDGPRVTRVSRPGDQPWLNPVRVAPPRLPRPMRSGTPRR